jgi:hypothetical protein
MSIRGDHMKSTTMQPGHGNHAEVPRAARRSGALRLALVAGAMWAGCGSSPTPGVRRAALPPELMAHFDAKAAQLPEGLAIHDKRAYVGFAPSGAIAALDLTSGELTPFAKLPAPVPNKGFMTGLAWSGPQLFAALVSFAPEVQAGIYRVPAGGGDASLFAHHANMVFPNGIAPTRQGTLYVTDSAAGSIFRVDGDGATVEWLHHELLRGAKDVCGAGKGVGVPFDIGANGIVLDGGALYVTNTDKATLVRVAIEADGRAGTPTVVAGPDCERLSGADGLTVDGDGNFIVAANHLNALVRIDRKGHIETLFHGPPFDFPASVELVGRTLFASNFSFLDAATPQAAPGLIRISY